MLHSQGSSQRRVRFDDDVVRLAEGGDLSARIEWVNFDLVDGGMYARLRIEKFLQLRHFLSVRN